MNSNILKQLEEFRNTWPVEEAVQYRVTRPSADFIGEEILEMAVMALLDGENLLLVGNKATGKNILAENLAWLFGRPIYNMSFHVNTDSAALIGTDTFENNEVKLRRGPVYRCAQYGGFGILDEINMAKSDAVAVLHAALDYRRLIDVPGYERISLHPATRFIGTMNYGYAGTKELNEALVSRFMVIQVPTLSQEDLNRLMDQTAPGMDFSMLDQFSSLFLDLQEKAVNGEISSRAVDLRGLLSALRMIKQGLAPARAIEMGMPLTAIVKQRVKEKKERSGGTRPLWIVLAVVGFPIWLPLLLTLGILVLTAYLLVWVVALVLWTVDLSAAVGAVGGLAGMLGGILQRNMSTELFAVGAALACAGLAILLFFAALWSTKTCARLGKALLRSLKAQLIGKETAA